MLEQQRAVDIRHLTLRKTRCPLAQLIERRKLAAERGGTRDHRVMRAVRAPRAGEPRLLVDGESLDDPCRQIEVGKPERIPAEHALRRAPPSTGPIEVKEVSQLVRHQQRHPILGVPKRRGIDRRVRVDQQPVRRERERLAIRIVDVVGDDDVHRPARWHQRSGELRPCLFSRGRCPPRERLHVGREVHAKMRCVERAPLATRVDLRVRRHGGHDQRRREQAAAAPPH